MKLNGPKSSFYKNKNRHHHIRSLIFFSFRLILKSPKKIKKPLRSTHGRWGHTTHGVSSTTGATSENGGDPLRVTGEPLFSSVEFVRSMVGHTIATLNIWQPTDRRLQLAGSTVGEQICEATYVATHGEGRREPFRRCRDPTQPLDDPPCNPSTGDKGPCSGRHQSLQKGNHTIPHPKCNPVHSYDGGPAQWQERRPPEIEFFFSDCCFGISQIFFVVKKNLIFSENYGGQKQISKFVRARLVSGIKSQVQKNNKRYD